MEVDDIETLVVAVEEYKLSWERCEEEILNLKKQIVELECVVREKDDSNARQRQSIAELEESIVIVDRELNDANDHLQEVTVENMALGHQLKSTNTQLQNEVSIRPVAERMDEKMREEYEFLKRECSRLTLEGAKKDKLCDKYLVIIKDQELHIDEMESWIATLEEERILSTSLGMREEQPESKVHAEYEDRQDLSAPSERSDTTEINLYTNSIGKEDKEDKDDLTSRTVSEKSSKDNSVIHVDLDSPLQFDVLAKGGSKKGIILSPSKLLSSSREDRCVFVRQASASKWEEASADDVDSEDVDSDTPVRRANNISIRHYVSRRHTKRSRVPKAEAKGEDFKYDDEFRSKCDNDEKITASPSPRWMRRLSDDKIRYTVHDKDDEIDGELRAKLYAQYEDDLASASMTSTAKSAPRTSAWKSASMRKPERCDEPPPIPPPFPHNAHTTEPSYIVEKYRSLQNERRGDNAMFDLTENTTANLRRQYSAASSAANHVAGDEPTHSRINSKNGSSSRSFKISERKTLGDFDGIGLDARRTTR